MNEKDLTKVKQTEFSDRCTIEPTITFTGDEHVTGSPLFKSEQELREMMQPHHVSLTDLEARITALEARIAVLETRQHPEKYNVYSV